MAETLLNYYLREEGVACAAFSRGLAAPVGRSPHQYAIRVSERHGVRIAPNKRAEMVTTAELMAAMVILVMDSGHRRELQRRFPKISGKVFLLGEWQGTEIEDPINEPEEFFESVWQKIDAGAAAWARNLKEANMVDLQKVTAS